MPRKVNTLVFIYNSFKDPLFQNLVLSYIKSVSEKTTGDFQLITFEQPAYALTTNEKKRVKAELSLHRIYWHPLTFHTGRFLLLKKAWDFTRAGLLVLWLRIRFRLSVIFCFANVSAAMGIVFAGLLRMKMIVYSYEPHARFLVELGKWHPRSLKFRILNFFEQLAAKKADFILTGTQYMVDELAQIRKPETTFRAPTAVDERAFIFRPAGRERIREKYGWNNRNIFLYLGKFGDLYYTHEIPQLFRAIAQNDERAVFLVVTSNDHSEIALLFSEFLPKDRFAITGNLTYDEVKDYISAADMGISGVPPSPSQKFRSPTKVAEYLLCGLPYLTCAGISEDDVFAEQNQVGVVMPNFVSRLGADTIEKLDQLLIEDKEALRKRCRAVGLEYRSRDTIISILEDIYQKLASGS